MYRVLLVEDESDLRTVLTMLMFHRGMEVVESVNGHEALKLIKAGERFDAIVTDLQMPFLDGLELVRRIRGLGVATPVVLISSLTDEQMVREAWSRGANALVAKPFEPKILIDKVQALLPS